MYKKHVLHILTLIILYQFTGKTNSFAQEIEKIPVSDKSLAIWIVQNFAGYVYWSNEASIDTFKIGVYGYPTVVYSELVELSKKKGANIKKKPYKIIHFKKIKEIIPVQIIFVEIGSNDYVKSIYEKAAYNTLIITDQSTDPTHIMINMLSTKSKQRFEIDQKKAGTAGISFDPKIVIYGGKEKEIKEVYDSLAIKLKKQQDSLVLLRTELSVKMEEFNKLKQENSKERTENDRQKQINKQQKSEIEGQQLEIANQKVLMDAVKKNLDQQQLMLVKNKDLLSDQREKIDLQQVEVLKRKKEIESQIVEIEKNKKILAGKDTVLSEQSSRISLMRKVIIGFIVLMVLVLALVFFIWRSYRIKQKINEELRYKNIAINRQKEEIANQQHQTELLNKELEKLSIVAARTDNAVTIMDKKGNIEWINVGYTRLYGYTLQLLKNELDGNLKQISSNSKIGEILDQCLAQKKSFVFETQNKTRNGTKIWVQTNLTPILDVDGEVSKLITIETDISKIKNAENEIRLQNEKILEQSQELELSNKELEKLSLVASETDNAIAILDSAGNYQWINDGFVRLFGYSYNQFISEYSGNIITKDTTDEIKDMIKSCIEDSTPVTYELVQKTREGKKVWVQTNLTPITDKEKNIKNLISISIDISQLKRAEQAIRQQSEELMAQKEELVLQKDRIEFQNQNIKASISYAKTIQNAILPTPFSLNQSFNAFIIYKPKDIVSGDFYWYTRISSTDSKKEKYFYAAVDCTGHGVPGAFMSMIGSRILNEIVNEKKIDKPSLILETMNDEIKNILRQEETDNNDGMDICLCALEPFNGNIKMTFAGAKRPLYYYKKDRKSLNYIKGTRKTIGGTHAKRNSEVFQDHEVLLDNGDIIYLSTDGIVDQPSPERIRFGSMRFVNLLKEIAEKPLTIQKDAIEKAVLEFQEDEQQRDDVTFLGIMV